MYGKIKTIVSEKGYGFITPEGGGKDIFFHVTGLVDVSLNDLRAGDQVEFETEDTQKGTRAIQITVIESAS